MVFHSDLWSCESARGGGGEVWVGGVRYGDLRWGRIWVEVVGYCDRWRSEAARKVISGCMFLHGVALRLGCGLVTRCCGFDVQRLNR